MKKLCICMILVAGCCTANAQMDEILQTMLEQIAQLKVYLSQAEKGYGIAENGLHAIRDIKNGEFKLHSDYFNSLRQVKPAVAEMDAVNNIRSLQARIMAKGQTLLKAAQSSTGLMPAEVAYVNSLVRAILKDCSKDVAALNDLTTDGSLSVSDGDRVLFIQALYEDVQKQDAVMSGYTVQVNQLMVRRMHEASMLGNLKKVYGL